MTSAIPVQRSTNWANKPTGSWSMNWVQINIQVNEDFRYMKIHIFALRWRDGSKTKFCTYALFTTLIPRNPVFVHMFFFFSTIYQVSWISLAFITVLLLFYRKPLRKKNERKINSRWLETHQKKTSASFVLELRKILSMKCFSCRQKIWSSLHSRSFVDTRIHEYTKIHEDTWRDMNTRTNIKESLELTYFPFFCESL